MKRDTTAAGAMMPAAPSASATHMPDPEDDRPRVADHDGFVAAYGIAIIVGGSACCGRGCGGVTLGITDARSVRGIILRARSADIAAPCPPNGAIASAR